MTVMDKTASRIDATVLVGGTLASRKGISLPDTVLPIGPLTEKDKKDLDFALRLGVDWVALSFVQRGEDMRLARQHRRPGRSPHVQDREAGGDHRPRRHRRGLGRPDGGARRSRRGAAGRARAGAAEADRQQGARRRQAGGGGDADAGEHDHLAGADARGGVGRGDRRVRRRRRHHAVGRVGGRQVSDRGDPHDGPHRHRGGERPQLRRDRARHAHAAAGDGRRRHRRRRAHRCRHPEAGGHHLLHGDRLHGACAWPASVPACP